MRFRNSVAAQPARMSGRMCGAVIRLPMMRCASYVALQERRRGKRQGIFSTVTAATCVLLSDSTCRTKRTRKHDHIG
jgi:hypothetical protein